VLAAGIVSIYVIHDVGTLDLDPAAAGFDAVIFGHSHQPAVREQCGVLFVNPGSAGRRRFKLPISVGRLVVEGSSVTAELVELVSTRDK
jgi:predicted phosphodiesterase